MDDDSLPINTEFRIPTVVSDKGNLLKTLLRKKKYDFMIFENFSLVEMVVGIHSGFKMSE